MGVENKLLLKRRNKEVIFIMVLVEIVLYVWECWILKLISFFENKLKNFFFSL